MNKLEAYLRLALAERRCLNCDNGVTGTAKGGSYYGPQGSCELCGGTGKVPLFPTLRAECPGVSSFSHVGLTVTEAGHIEKRCHGCAGRGWVPTNDPWALHRAIRAEGYYVAYDDKVVELLHSPHSRPHDIDGRALGYGSDDEKKLLDAALKLIKESV